MSKDELFDVLDNCEFDDIYDEFLDEIQERYPDLPMTYIGISMVTHFAEDLIKFGGWTTSDIVEHIPTEKQIINHEVGGMTMN